MSAEGKPPPRLVLFQTLGCHLCVEASRAIATTLATERPEFEAVDIADDDALLQRYGTRIPVLRREDSGAELDWPFTADDVARFLTELS